MESISVQLQGDREECTQVTAAEEWTIIGI